MGGRCKPGQARHRGRRSPGHGNLRRAAKIRFVADLGTALNDYLKASQGQLPSDLSELKPYFKKPVMTPRCSATPSCTPARSAMSRQLSRWWLKKAPGGRPVRHDVQDLREGYSMQGVGRWNGTGLTNKWTFLAGELTQRPKDRGDRGEGADKIIGAKFCRNWTRFDAAQTRWAGEAGRREVQPLIRANRR